MKEPEIYELANGYGFRMDVGTHPVTGKRDQKRFGPFRTKKEARNAISKIRTQRNEGTFVSPSNMKLGEFLIRWLEHKEKHVSAGTYSHYKPYVYRHLIPNLGNIKMVELRPIHIQELYDDYVEEETLANQSILHMHRVLNNAYNTAIEWELVGGNPCKAVKPPKPEKFEMKVWDETEIQFFLDEAKEDRFYIIYLLALSTGMRKGELLGLRWQDIDLTNGYLSVRQAVSRKKGGGHELGKLKTPSSYRNISLFDFVIEALKRHKLEHMKFKMENRDKYKDQDLIISAANGNFILPRNLDREWIALRKDSPLKDIRFHDLRHTHATLMLKQGVHPKIVQERLGHSSITVTLDTYSHVLPNIQGAAAKQFGEHVFGDKNTNVDSKQNTFVPN